METSVGCGRLGEQPQCAASSDQIDMETSVGCGRLDEPSQFVDGSAQEIMHMLRTEIKQGFDQLSMKLVEEIKEVRLKGASPLTINAIAPQSCSSIPSLLPRATSPEVLKEQEFQIVPEDNNAPQVIRASLKKQVSQSWLSSTSENVHESAHNWRSAMTDRVQSHRELARRLNSFSSAVHHAEDKAKLVKLEWLYRLVHGKLFTSLCMSAILANAFWMGYEADHRSATDSGWGKWVSKIFNIWFIFELALKIVADRQAFMFGTDSQWNLLDTVCVLSSVPDFFSTSINVSFLRMVRLAKLTRGLRLVRLLRFLKDLREILMTVFYTMGSLFWSFIAILFVAYIFALLFLQVLGMHLDDGEQFSTDTMQNFDSVVSTMKALFSMITGGQEWYPFALDFHEHGAHIAETALFFWMFFMLFGLVNVVIAVFCAQAEQVGRARNDLRIQKDKDRQAKNFAEWIKIFQAIDTESRGYVEWAQFHKFATSIDGEHLLQSHGLNHFALNDFWALMDDYSGTDGQVDMTGLVMGFMRLSEDFYSSNFMLLSCTLQTLSRDSKDMIRELQVDLSIIKQIFEEYCQFQARVFSAQVSAPDSILQASPPDVSL